MYDIWHQVRLVIGRVNLVGQSVAYDTEWVWCAGVAYANVRTGNSVWCANISCSINYSFFYPSCGEALVALICIAMTGMQQELKAKQDQLEAKQEGVFVSLFFVLCICVCRYKLRIPMG